MPEGESLREDDKARVLVRRGDGAAGVSCQGGQPAGCVALPTGIFPQSEVEEERGSNDGDGDGVV